MMNINFPRWEGRIDFVFSVLSCAIGLSDFWRFPYLCHKYGGGAFLIPYILCSILIGCPLMYLESCLGQFRGRSVFKIYDLCPILRGQGISQVFTSTVVAYYYVVILGYSAMFCIEGLYDTVLWENCHQEYNSADCFVIGEGGNNTHFLASYEYMRHKVAMVNDSKDYIGKLNSALFGIVCFIWIINAISLSLGTNTINRTTYPLVLMPYITIFAMCMKTITLDGSWEGFVYFWTPDPLELFQLSIWKEAIAQIFFSLGISHASILTLSSFNSFHHSSLRFICGVVVFKCILSFVTGMVVFGAIGFIAKQVNKPVHNCLPKEIVLALRIYPEILRQMGPYKIWTFTFYFGILSLGVVSQSGLTEPLMSAVCELARRFKLLRNTADHVVLRLILCAIVCILTLPLCCENGMFLWNAMDSALIDLPVVVFAFNTSFMVSWIYGYKRFQKDIQFMTGHEIHMFWHITWRFALPLITFFIIFVEIFLENTTPDTPYFFAPVFYIFHILPIAIIYIYGVIFVIYNGGYVSILEASKPLSSWGPEQEAIKLQYRNSLKRTKIESSVRWRYFSDKENVIERFHKSKNRFSQKFIHKPSN